MVKFIAGIAVAALVHYVGWPRIEAATRTAGVAAKSAYHAAETELRAERGGK